MNQSAQLVTMVQSAGVCVFFHNLVVGFLHSFERKQIISLREPAVLNLFQEIRKIPILKFKINYVSRGWSGALRYLVFIYFPLWLQRISLCACLGKLITTFLCFEAHQTGIQAKTNTMPAIEQMNRDRNKTASESYCHNAQNIVSSRAMAH